MEFLIEMKTPAPGLRLKSVKAESLFEGVMKITAIVIKFCAENPFVFKVKLIKTNTYMVHFKIFFDNRRQTEILLFDPAKYPDAKSIYNQR